MNLQTHLQEPLWRAIADTYEAKNYSHAILDAIHYLSDVLREKAGVDGDGVSLVGQALGGNSPRLRINKYQTQTERGIQEGFVQILLGLYRGIRNPRSHEQFTDSKETTDAIIYFVNYVLIILDESHEPFTTQDFLSRVFDPHFVKSEDYAEILANRIPEKKRVDTLIEIYRKKTEGDGSKLKYIFSTILKQLSNSERAEFLGVVSDELETTQDDSNIILVLQILPPELWVEIGEAARLRTETRLIKSIKNGKSDEGFASVLAKDFIQYFTLREEASRILIRKITTHWDSSGQNYVATYFMDILPQVAYINQSEQKCIDAISTTIRRGNNIVRNALIDHIKSYPEDWQHKFADSLRDLIDSKNPGSYLSDGTPFLTDGIPF